MSCVMCHVSCVRCHLSSVIFFLIIKKKMSLNIWTKGLSELVEGLLSTGPTPSSYAEVLIIRVSSGQVIQTSQLFYVDSFSHIKPHPSNPGNMI